MKKIIVIVLVSLSHFGWSQSVDPHEFLVSILVQDTTTLDSLVAGALNNSYLIEAMEAEKVQKEFLVRQERKRWMSSFRLGINFFNVNTTAGANNEGSITTTSLLPNLGLTVSLDPEKFVNLRNRKKVAQLEVVRAQKTKLNQQRIIRDFITSKYYDYLEALNVIEIRTNALEAQRERFEVASYRFVEGKIRVEELMVVENGLYNLEEAVMKAKVFAMKLEKELQHFSTDTEGHIQ